MNRRAFLASGVALGAGLAGCVSDSDDAGSDDDNGNGKQDCIASTTITTTETDCSRPGDDHADVDVDGDAVTVVGVLGAPNPCHRAVLEKATVDEGVLRISVGRQSTLGEGEVCQTCVGAISYEASVEVFSLDALEDVRVEHPDGSSYWVLGGTREG